MLSRHIRSIWSTMLATKFSSSELSGYNYSSRTYIPTNMGAFVHHCLTLPSTHRDLKQTFEPRRGVNTAILHQTSILAMSNCRWSDDVLIQMPIHRKKIRCCYVWLQEAINKFILNRMQTVWATVGNSHIRKVRFGQRLFYPVPLNWRFVYRYSHYGL